MTTMQAVVAIAYGEPDVLKMKNVEKPIPGKGEVRVKVKTSAATTADSMMRSGKPYFARLFLGLFKPKKAIPGTGFSGVIDAIGDDVTQFKVGDRVFGETAFRFSANADFLIVSEDGVVLPMPVNLEFTQAANFCDGHLTSYNFLKEIAKIEEGHKILIIGASGALGTSAVQIAHHYGAKVTGVASGKNEGLIRSLGADDFIDYTSEDYTASEEEYDFVYDTIGISSFKKCKSILKTNGVYLSPVLSFSLLLQVLKTSFWGRKKAKFDATGANPQPKLKKMLSEVLEIFSVGKLKTIIDRQYPLEKLADAHRYIETGRKKGNLVIQHST